MKDASFDDMDDVIAEERGEAETLSNNLFAMAARANAFQPLRVKKS